MESRIISQHHWPQSSYTHCPPPSTFHAQPVSFLSLGLTLATGAGLYLWFQQQQDKKIVAAQKSTTVVGAAAIGGPFQLVDHRGRPFSDKDLLGRWTLLYFGFTQCPDICPEELEKIVEAKQLAEKETGTKLTTVFVSVDPERDTVAQVAEYVKEFDPDMIGLTGTLEQVRWKEERGAIGAQALVLGARAVACMNRESGCIHKSRERSHE